MSVTKHQDSVILSRVFTLVEEKVSSGDAPLIKQFGRLLFKNMSFDDLVGRSDSDLYGATLSLWRSMESNVAEQSTIRVFNPEIAKHGWQSSHTVIEIIVKDMPFLVDSVRMVINRLGISAHLLLHTPMHVVRDKNNRLTGFVESEESGKKGVSSETVFWIEIDRQTKSTDIDALKQELLSVVEEVSLTVQDWLPMRAQLEGITKAFDKSNSKATKATKSQCKTFLNWVSNHNFTLMGYRYYQVKAISGDHRWVPENESSLGLMKNSISDRPRLLSSLPPSARGRSAQF